MSKKRKGGKQGTRNKERCRVGRKGWGKTWRGRRKGCGKTWRGGRKGGGETFIWMRWNSVNVNARSSGTLHPVVEGGGDPCREPNLWALQ
jgi:hypothetical protein